MLERKKETFRGEAARFAASSINTSYPEIGGELLSNFGGDLDEARTAAEENYSGCYKSLTDYAEELTEETTQIPENLSFYIDYEKMGRDMESSGDIFTIETGFEEVHIFWNH